MVKHLFLSKKMQKIEDDNFKRTVRFGPKTFAFVGWKPEAWIWKGHMDTIGIQIISACVCALLVLVRVRKREGERDGVCICFI